METKTREIFQIHVGHAGIQLAYPIWEIYRLEHGINPNGLMQEGFLEENPFFQTYENRKIVPKLLMLDTKSYAIDRYRNSFYKNIFHPDSMICDRSSGTAHIFGNAYRNNDPFMKASFEQIRKLSESSNNPQGFLMYRSFGGGTGCGLGASFWENIVDDFPKATKFEFGIFPSAKCVEHPLELINTILGINLTLDTCDCSFSIENDACKEICVKQLKIESACCSQVNQIIGQVISTITSTLRHPGERTLSLAEIQATLIPYPRIRFPIVSYSPYSFEPDENNEAQTIKLMTKCLEPQSNLTKFCTSFGKHMSCIFLFQGNIQLSSVNSSVEFIRKRKLMKFVDWSTSGIKLGITDAKPISILEENVCCLPQSACLLSNNTCAKNSFEFLLSSYRKNFKKTQAFLHHFFREGLEEIDLREAEETLQNLIDCYNGIQRGTDNGGSSMNIKNSAI